MAEQVENFYNIPQTLVVKSIVNAMDKYPKKDEPTKTWYKHFVTFHCEDALTKEYQGTFFQLEKKEFEFNGKVVVPGESLCFMPTVWINEKFKDQLKFCYDKKNPNPDAGSNPNQDYPNPDAGKIKSVSLSYSKDLCISFFSGKENISLDHIADEIIRIGIKFEEHLLK